MTIRDLAKKLLPTPVNHSAPEVDPLEQLVETICQEMLSAQRHYCALEISTSETFKAFRTSAKPKDLGQLAVYLFDNRERFFKSRPGRAHAWGNDWPKFVMFCYLSKSNLGLENDIALGWLETITQECSFDFFNSDSRKKISYRELPISDWPFTYLVKQIERQAKLSSLNELQSKRLLDIYDWMSLHENEGLYSSDFTTPLRNIRKILERVMPS